MHMYKAENNFYGGEGIVGDQVSLAPAWSCILLQAPALMPTCFCACLLLQTCSHAVTVMDVHALRTQCQPVLKPACNNPALSSRS